MSAANMASSFPKFSLLPLEIRLLIWENACFIPHHLGCYWFQQPYHKGPVPLPAEIMGPIPPIMQVCKEARREALCHYDFDPRLNNTESASSTTRPRSYINWKTDRLVIMAPCHWINVVQYISLLKVHQHTGIRYLAWNIYNPLALGPTTRILNMVFSALRENLGKCPSITEIILFSEAEQCAFTKPTSSKIGNISFEEMSEEEKSRNRDVMGWKNWDAELQTYYRLQKLGTPPATKFAKISYGMESCEELFLQDLKEFHSQVWSLIMSGSKDNVDVIF